MEKSQMLAIAEWAPPGQLAAAFRLVEGKIHRRWIERFLPYCAGGVHAGQNDSQYIGGRAEEIVNAKKAGFSYKQIERLLGSRNMHVVISLVTLHGLTPVQAMKLFRSGRDIWQERSLIEMGFSIDQLAEIKLIVEGSAFHATAIGRFVRAGSSLEEVLDYCEYDMDEATIASMVTLSESWVPVDIAYEVAVDGDVDPGMFGQLYQALLVDCLLDVDYRRLIGLVFDVEECSLRQLKRFAPELSSLPIEFEQLVELCELFGTEESRISVRDFLEALDERGENYDELLSGLERLGGESQKLYLELLVKGVSDDEAIVRAVLGGLFGYGRGHMAAAGVSLPDALRVQLAGGNVDEFVGAAGLGFDVDGYLATRVDAD